MATKEAIQPTVNDMRSTADLLTKAAKVLEINYENIPKDVALEAVSAFSLISNAIRSFTDGVVMATARALDEVNKSRD